MLGHGAQGEEAAALSVVEDDIVAQQRMQRIYQSPCKYMYNAKKNSSNCFTKANSSNCLLEK